MVSLLVATSTLAHAAQAVAEEQMETASPLAIWLFAMLFFGGCAWYAWMTWRNEKKDREAKKEGKHVTG
jgi:hypothetical protein